MVRCLLSFLSFLSFFLPPSFLPSILPWLFGISSVPLSDVGPRVPPDEGTESYDDSYPNAPAMSLFASMAQEGDLWGAGDGGADLFHNPMQELLETGTFTLDDVLSQPTLIQELRNLNESLVNYLKTVVPELLQKALSPDLSADMASEIFACEVQELNCALGDEGNLSALFGALEQPTIGARSAGNLLKLITVALKEHRRNTLAWLSAHPAILDHFLRHIDLDSISTALRQLLDDGEGGAGGGEEGGDEAVAEVVLWEPATVVSGLIAIFSKASGRSAIACQNAAEALMDSVQRSSYQPPAPSSFGDWMNNNRNEGAEEPPSTKVPLTPLMAVILTPDTTNSLIEALPNRGAFHILTRTLEFAIDAKDQNDEGEATVAYVDIVAASMDRIIGLLSIADEQTHATTFGKTVPAFGIERLLALELISAMAHLRPQSLSDANMSLLFDLIARYPTHNILHAIVTGIVLDRGQVGEDVTQKLRQFFESAEERPLEISYAGHYMRIAIFLELTDLKALETMQATWSKELGGGAGLGSSGGAGAGDWGGAQPELEYGFDSDSDEEEEEEDEILRQRYGFGVSVENAETSEEKNNTANSTGAGTTPEIAEDDDWAAFGSNGQQQYGFAPPTTEIGDGGNGDKIGGEAEKLTSEESADDGWATFGSGGNGGTGDAAARTTSGTDPSPREDWASFGAGDGFAAVEDADGVTFD